MRRVDYILRSLSKISSKVWEHYAINRIYHRLNDPDIEFVCQQCIRNNDKIYLADLYFPQLGIYLEIDEGQHNSDEAIIRDAKRRFDIAEVSDIKEIRIPAFGVSLNEFNKNLDQFINAVINKKAELEKSNDFIPWDYEHRLTAAPHIKAGFIEIGTHSAFRTHKDALNCFGYNKGHLQKAYWNLPSDTVKAIGLTGSCMVWFPKLYDQKNWQNSLSVDGETIYEINKNIEPNEHQEKWDKRIVMAHSRDELNRTLYRFLGVFEIIPQYSTGNERRYRRVATKINTYPQNT